MTVRAQIEICWLGVFGVMELGDPLPPCDGQLIRVHLIPRQLLKRNGANQWDRRSWVWCCGGPTGIGGHHGMLDSSRTLRVPRAAIPSATEQLALELGLMWWLDETYGERVRVPPRAGETA
jgi:hypothetical protein